MRRATDEGGVLLEGVSKVFGTLRVLDDVSLRAGPGEVVAVVGPSGCGKSTLLELACGLQTPEAGTVRGRARRPHAPARQPPPLGRGARQRRAAAASEGAGPRDGPRGRARDVRHLRARRLRGRPAPRAVRRDAPARRLPAHVARGQAGAVPRRAVRLAGRAHAPGAADLARGRPADGAAHGAARDARRRGGARARRPRHRPLAPPGAVRATLESTCPARGRARIRRSSPCASARSGSCVA